VEHFIDKERSAAESVRIITRRASERIIRFAFEYAAREGRKKVTVIHKANILKATDGLFLEVAKDVACSYPQIEFEDKLIDNMAMQLVKNPHLYDILVAPNLYGDILSDLCSGLVGGLGLAPGANIGEEFAIFEPVHGSVPKYAGADKVNPSASILSGVLMLKHIGEHEAADKIIHALEEVIMEGRFVTYDLGGKSSTSEMVKAIIDKLKDA
jgi:isocitrate dehydrogenase (NAD+)